MKIAMIGIISFLVSMTLMAKEHGHGPCKSDMEKFCKDIKPGGGKIMECMKSHESELSAECKAHAEKMKENRSEKKEEMKEQHKEMIEACKADKEKFCKEIEPGQGRIMRCFKEHKKEVSEACKSSMKELRKSRM